MAPKTRRRGGAATEATGATVSTVAPGATVATVETDVQASKDSPEQESAQLSTREKLSSALTTGFHVAGTATSGLLDTTSYIVDKALEVAIRTALGPITALISTTAYAIRGPLEQKKGEVILYFAKDTEALAIVSEGYDLVGDSVHDVKLVSLLRIKPLVAKAIAYWNASQTHKDFVLKTLGIVKKASETELSIMVNQSQMAMQGYNDSPSELSGIQTKVEVFLQQIVGHVQQGSPKVVFFKELWAPFNDGITILKAFGIPSKFSNMVPVKLAKYMALKLLEMYTSDVSKLKPWPALYTHDNNIRKQLTGILDAMLSLGEQIYSGVVSHQSDIHENAMMRMKDILFKIKTLMDYHAEHPTTDKLLLAYIEVLSYVDTTEAEEKKWSLFGGKTRKMRKRRRRTRYRKNK
jgi:hypothetical protein